MTHHYVQNVLGDTFAFWENMKTVGPMVFV